MILRSVELESFGRFRNQTVEFRRGMNLVIGPNEAGKSTIAEAVPAVLFGTDRLERYKPWGRNACSATLFFEGQGRTIKVKRDLVTDDVELVEKDDLYHVLSEFSGKAPLRGKSTSCREYRILLESLLGVADEHLFRATYFFGHQPKEWSGKELAQKLRTLVSGTAEADYAEILDDLLAEHFQLTRNNPWGRDKKRNRDYEDVCQQLAEMEVVEGAGTLESDPAFVEIDRSADIREQIEILYDELESDQQEYEKGLLYIERIRQQSVKMADDVVQNIVEEPPASTQTPEDKGSFAEQFVALGLPKNPPRELPDLLAEAAEVRQEFAALQRPFAELNTREKKIPVVPWLVLSVFIATFIAVGAIAWWQNLYPLWVSIGVGLLSASFLGWGGWRHMARKKALAECLKERGRLEQKKMASQQRQSVLTDRCEGLGLPSSAIDLVRIQKLVTSHRELLEKWWTQGDLSVKEDVFHHNSADSCSSSNAAIIESPNASTAAEEFTHELQQLEKRMAEFKVELEQKEMRLQKLQLQIKASSSEQNTKSVASGTVLHKRKLEMEDRITVLRKAVNLLAGAVDEFSHSHLMNLNVEASKLLSKITNGRYVAIKLDESMVPSVQVDERRWMPVESFSRGTVDAIYLSLRVALAKVRDDGRSLPLMLDDPFVHLDQKRLATTLNLVDLASADGQLILFSHNLELGKRAARERWHVVPLDGDAAVANSEEGDDHAGQLHLL